MKPPTLWEIAMLPWDAFCICWLITWRRVKRTKTAEPLASRLMTIVPLVLGFGLLMSNVGRIGFLAERFLPAREWIAWIGVGITSLGAGLAIWARYCIGEYWSSRVTLKEGHQLIRTGPYAFVRHPIYTGLLLAVIGTAIVVGEWRAILSILLVLAAHAHKALREERLLISEFGDEYASYRRHTGFLFPRIPGGAGVDTPVERT